MNCSRFRRYFYTCVGTVGSLCRSLDTRRRGLLLVFLSSDDVGSYRQQHLFDDVADSYSHYFWNNVTSKEKKNPLVSCYLCVSHFNLTVRTLFNALVKIKKFTERRSLQYSLLGCGALSSPPPPFPPSSSYLFNCTLLRALISDYE
jgi:hypothetical protein